MSDDVKEKEQVEAIELERDLFVGFLRDDVSRIEHARDVLGSLQDGEGLLEVRLRVRRTQRGKVQQRRIVLRDQRTEQETILPTWRRGEGRKKKNNNNIKRKNIKKTE